MFFSRITAEPFGLSPRELMKMYYGDLYGDHQLLWRLFDTKQREFLFRREQSGRSETSIGNRNALPVFYMVSKERPKDLKGFKIETKIYLPMLEEGMRFGFNLRANPVKAKSNGLGAKSVRNSVVHYAVQDAKERALSHQEKQQLIDEALKIWLLSRAEKAGFDLQPQQFVCDRYDVQSFTKRQDGKPQDVTIATIDYDGFLTVTDPELFRQTLYKGIGRARSFGCGLMMIRRGT